MSWFWLSLGLLVSGFLVEAQGDRKLKKADSINPYQLVWREDLYSYGPLANKNGLIDRQRKLRGQGRNLKQLSTFLYTSSAFSFTLGVADKLLVETDGEEVKLSYKKRF